MQETIIKELSTPSTPQLPTRLIDLKPADARAHLLESEQYMTMSLPGYLDFGAVLRQVEELVGDTPLEECLKAKLPATLDANHTIMTSKDGAYAMRPISLSHPLLYYCLVRELTSRNTWSQIRRAFASATDKRIAVSSLPLIPQPQEAFRQATTILNWWQEVERRSVELSLDYSYMLVTDITNCYGTLDMRLLSEILPRATGGRLAYLVQLLQGGSPIGIPQGAEPYNLIAELVLAAIDKRLMERLLAEGISEGFHIIRYRDDYRIYSNDREQLERIYSALQAVLLGANCQLSISKTGITNDIILSSIKRDKLYMIENTPIASKKGCDFDSVQKYLTFTLLFATRYRDSGSICSLMSDLLRRVEERSIYWDRSAPAPLCAMVVQLLQHNPRIYLSGMKLLVLLMEEMPTEERVALKRRIRRRLLGSILNSAVAQLWMQLLFVCDGVVEAEPTDAVLCRWVAGEPLQLWDRSFLRGKYAQFDYEAPLLEREQLVEQAKKPIVTGVDLYELLSQGVWESLLGSSTATTE